MLCLKYDNDNVKDDDDNNVTKADAVVFDSDDYYGVVIMTSYKPSLPPSW